MAALGLSSLEDHTQGSGVGQRPVSPEASSGPASSRPVSTAPALTLCGFLSSKSHCPICLSQSTRASMCPSDRDSSPLNKPSSHPGFYPSIQTVVCPPSTRCPAVHHPALLATVHQPSIYLSTRLPPQPSTPCIFSWPPLVPSSLSQPPVTPLVLLGICPLSVGAAGGAQGEAQAPATPGVIVLGAGEEGDHPHQSQEGVEEGRQIPGRAPGRGGARPGCLQSFRLQLPVETLRLESAGVALRHSGAEELDAAPRVQGGCEGQGGALGTRQPWGHRSLEARRPGASTGLRAGLGTRRADRGWGAGRAEPPDLAPLLSRVGREPRPAFHAPVFYLCCPGSGAVREAR